MTTKQETMKQMAMFLHSLEGLPTHQQRRIIKNKAAILVDTLMEIFPSKGYQAPTQPSASWTS